MVNIETITNNRALNKKIKASICCAVLDCGIRNKAIYIENINFMTRRETNIIRLVYYLCLMCVRVFRQVECASNRQIEDGHFGTFIEGMLNVILGAEINRATVYRKCVEFYCLFYFIFIFARKCIHTCCVCADKCVWIYEPKMERIQIKKKLKSICRHTYSPFSHHHNRIVCPIELQAWICAVVYHPNVLLIFVSVNCVILAMQLERFSVSIFLQLMLQSGNRVNKWN